MVQHNPQKVHGSSKLVNVHADADPEIFHLSRLEGRLVKLTVLRSQRCSIMKWRPRDPTYPLLSVTLPSLSVIRVALRFRLTLREVCYM